MIIEVDGKAYLRVMEATTAIVEALQEPDGLSVMEAMAALGIVLGHFIDEWPKEERLEVMASWYATLQRTQMIEADDA